MATLDLITTAEAKRAINLPVTNVAHDTEIGAYIEAISLRIDDLCGPVVVRTLTNEAQDGGRSFVDLDYRPASTVTTVTEYDNTTATVLTAETNSTKPDAGYIIDLPTARVFRRASNADWWFPRGRKNVVVTYVAGRAANTAAVSRKFKQACEQWFANVWRLEQGSGGQVFGESLEPITMTTPKRVLDLLVTEVLVPGVA